MGAVVALSLSGCGEATGPAEFNATTAVLTKKQATTALLTASELGKGFIRSHGANEATTVQGTGCMAKLEGDDGPQPEVEVEASYQRSGALPFPFVETSVASFAISDDLAASIETMRDALAKCHKLEFTDKGVKATIKLDTDNVPSASAVDQQLNIRGVGSMTVTSKKVKREVPLGLWMSFVKVGNQGVSVMVLDINPRSARLLNKYTAKAVERLHMVAEGKTPDEKKPAKPKSTKKANTKSNA